MKRFSLLLAIVMLASLVAPIAAYAQDKATTVTTSFIEGDPKTLDPHAALNVDEFGVLYNIYEGLVTYDPKTLQPKPGLAEKWDVSKDGLVYTFHLRKGVKFQNGREMTADDVKYSFTRLANPTTGTSYTGLLLDSVKGIKELRASFQKVKEGTPTPQPVTDLVGVKVVDPQTVEITLTSPVASFLNQLTLPGGFIVPKESADQKDFNEKPVGTGPYMLKEWKRQDHLTLEANPNYWGGAPAVKTAIMRNIPEQSQQVIEYEGGNLDLALVPEADLPRVKGDANLSKALQSIPLLNVVHLRFNLQDPNLSKPEVRQALGMAIDRDVLVKTVLGGNATPAVGMIPPGLSAYDKSYNPFPHDIAKAKELLAKAGFPNGIDLEVRTGQVETERRVLAAIQQMVAEAGIRLKINATEKSVWDADRAACKMQMGTISWGMDYPDPDNVVSLVTAGTSGSRKACHYDTYPQAAELDKALADASKIPVGPDRDAAYQKINKMAMDIAVLVPLYHATRNVLINPRLQGTVMDANSVVRFNMITIGK